MIFQPLFFFLSKKYKFDYIDGLKKNITGLIEEEDVNIHILSLKLLKKMKHVQQTCHLTVKTNKVKDFGLILSEFVKLKHTC